MSLYRTRTFHALRESPLPAQAVTLQLPTLFDQRNGAAAHELVMSFQKAAGAAWLPEAMTLVGMPGLSPTQRRDMALHLAPHVPEGAADLLSTTLADIGRWGFSFPLWRFLAQPGANGSQSILQTFGMRLLQRPETDYIDPALGTRPSNQRFGLGSEYHSGDWRIEYRRAYIMCTNFSSQDSVTLVIRNNSPFFGRDSLPEPAYVRFDPVTAERLRGFNQQSVWPSGPYRPFAELDENAYDVLSVAEKLRRVRLALDQIQSFDDHLAGWLATDGLYHVAQLSDVLASKQKGDAIGTPPFYLARMGAQDLPWRPEAVVPANAELGQMITEGDRAGIAGLFDAHVRDRKLVLLSNAVGDTPYARHHSAPNMLV